jgi:hypothetical protein
MTRQPDTRKQKYSMRCGVKFVSPMEFFSAMKKNEILPLASKWMELENIILSEISQAQKTKNPMFSLICRL